jgi:major membrane immunogen (membrane-anchored lipoprotein)
MVFANPTLEKWENHEKIFVFTVLAMSLILAACGSSSPSTFPSGNFIKSGTTDYGLVFNKDGTFSPFSGDTTFVTGTYSVDGNIFTETSNDGGCKTNVSFNYIFDGMNLTFNYVGDPANDADCSGRNTDFNNVIYTLTK